MFIDMNLIFTLINFGTLVGLGVYLYRAYGRDMLYEYMRSQKDAIRLLELEEQALLEEKERLKKLSQEEQRMAALLNQKMQRWRAVQDQERKDELATQQHIQKLLEEKVDKQLAWYAQYRLAGRLLPQVIEKARVHLDQEFAGSKKQAEYAQEILNYMKKSQQ